MKKWWFAHIINPSENAEISIHRLLWCCHLAVSTSTLDRRAVSTPLTKNNEFKELRCFGRLSLSVFPHGCSWMLPIVDLHGNAGSLSPDVTPAGAAGWQAPMFNAISYLVLAGLLASLLGDALTLLPRQRLLYAVGHSSCRICFIPFTSPAK